MIMRGLKDIQKYSEGAQAQEKGINKLKYRKFAARGMKGHKARSGGGVHVRFEGGQTPISRKLPKFGRIKRK